MERKGFFRKVMVHSDIDIFEVTIFFATIYINTFPLMDIIVMEHVVFFGI